jgi:hypothetical protein
MFTLVTIGVCLVASIALILRELRTRRPRDLAPTYVAIGLVSAVVFDEAFAIVLGLFRG